jgi:UDP-glucose 4-epimerase
VIFGDGTQARDFVYVDDIVGSLLASVGRAGGPYNVGTGRDTTVADLHAACAHVAGSDREPRHEPARLGDVQRSVLDAGLIEHELGWLAQVTLDDGLARTWAWMADRVGG